jgi:phage-related protein
VSWRLLVGRAFALASHRSYSTTSEEPPLSNFNNYRDNPPGVLEIVSDHRGDTYRSVYTVRFTDVVYVLHVFQKKSKKGARTPQSEIELVRQRLKRAAELHEQREN